MSEIELKAHAFLADSTQRINELDFTDYDRIMIERDLALVAKREAEFDRTDTPTEKELKKISTIFEIMLAELVELYDWLGDNVFIVNTSKYDDIVGGTDMVAEFFKDGSVNYLGLAIDVTFSKDKLETKLRKVADKINDGELVTIKYFQSGNGDLVGKLINIPRVVLGASRQVIGEIAEAKLNLESLKRRKENPMPSENINSLTRQIKEIKARLANHPLQFEILSQLETQLKIFGDHATKVGQPHIAQKYYAVLGIIKRIRKAKEENANLVLAAVARGNPDASMDSISLRITESLNRILES